ncbi:MAG TPA: hypothetical protein EYG74_03885 [Sulfurimonas autotrophica]|nr:hypothetical protein [Sulfurimonas autotrophica]
MDSFIPLKKTIQESCNKIESYITSQNLSDNDPFEVVSKSIEILLDQMRSSGYKNVYYSIDINRFKQSFNYFQYNILNELENSNKTVSQYC